MLHTVTKIHEKSIHTQLVIYFEKNTLFTDTHYSYRSGCSTEFASMDLQIAFIIIFKYSFSVKVNKSTFCVCK